MVAETTTVSSGTTYKSNPEGFTITTDSGAKDIKAKDSVFGLRLKSGGFTISGLSKANVKLTFTYCGGKDRTVDVYSDSSKTTSVINAKAAANGIQTATVESASVPNGILVFVGGSSDVFINTIKIE